MWLEATCTDHLAGFIGCRGDHRQPLRNTRRCRCLCRNLSQLAGRGYQLNQHSWIHRYCLPFPIALTGPSQLLIIEREIANLAAYGIYEPSGHPVGQVA